MVWDQQLLKKYNSTSHIRLLNQLKTELKTAINLLDEKRNFTENKLTQKTPIINKKELNIEYKSQVIQAAASVQPIESNTIFKNTDNFVHKKTSNEPNSFISNISKSEANDSSEDQNKKSFKERLDDIDMR
tara:strand:- start:286 stop:678 length:393 start_codon:yes stop_codon:yes gene_type:complete